MGLIYKDKITNYTPLIRKIPNSGGSFYTFSSAAEDFTNGIAEINDIKFRFSKFALIKIPDISNVRANQPGEIKNTINFNSIPGAYTTLTESGISQNTTEDPNNVKFIQLFQNYCLNLETGILSKNDYDPALHKTVSERVFWKWIKEMGGIQFINNPVSNDTFFESENVENSYERVVKYIGDLSLTGRQQNQFATYTELYLHVPEFIGNTKDVQFKSNYDRNYSENLRIERNNDSLNNEIIFGHKYTDIHPAAIDMRAIYDNDDGFSFFPINDLQSSLENTGLFAFKKVNGVDGVWEPNQWWYNFSTHNGHKNHYFLEQDGALITEELGLYYGRVREFVDYTNHTTLFNPLHRFKRSNLDAIEINWNLSDYSVEGVAVKDWTELAITEDSDSFEFNAILIYYDLYSDAKDSDGNTLYDIIKINDIEEKIIRPDIKATNLFGVLFLDNVAKVSNELSRIQSFYKYRSNEATQIGGNEFGFKLNFRVDTNTRLVDVTHIPMVAENNTIAMGMFIDSIAKMIQTSDTISSTQASILEISNTLKEFLRIQKTSAYDFVALAKRLQEIEKWVESNPRTSLLDNIEQLYPIYLKLSNDVSKMLMGQVSPSLLVDTSLLESGSGIYFEQLNNNKLIVHSLKDNFNYSTKSFFGPSDLHISQHSHSYTYNLLPGKNYLRFEDLILKDVTLDDVNFDIYISTDLNKWDIGQVLKCYFATNLTLSSGKLINIWTNIEPVSGALHNPKFKLVGSVKCPCKMFELHCLDKNKLQFIIDNI